MNITDYFNYNFIGLALIAIVVFVSLIRRVKVNPLKNLIGNNNLFLSRYSRDLNALAKEGKLDSVIGRDNEVNRAVRILCRRTKNNVVLIGDAGVGKTAIAEGLASFLISADVPEQLKNKRVLSLSLGALLAGTKYRGEFEQRIEAITRELIANERKIILFIDEIQSLTQAGEATGAIGAANLLKPFLARGELQIIGACTPFDYFKYIQNDTSLERRFQPIVIKEPTVPETIRIIFGLKKHYEEFHHIKISDSVVKECVELTQKYLTERYFPDKAIDLIDEAAARVVLKSVKKLSDSSDSTPENYPEISKEDLEQVLFEWSNDVNWLKERQELLKSSSQFE